MKKILLIIIVIIFFIVFIRYDNNKNLYIKVLNEINVEVLNVKKDILKVDLKLDIIKKYNSIQKDLIKLKNSMPNENYGIKKETLILKDTINDITLKINYPLIYTFKENNIVYFNYSSAEILNLIFAELYNFIPYNQSRNIEHSKNIFDNSLNNILIYNDKNEFDYKVSYIDKDFFSVDYTNIITYEIGGKVFISDLTTNFWFSYDEDKKLDFILLIDKDDLIEDEEILNIIKSGNFNELSDNKNLMKPFVEELNKIGKIPKDYSLTKEFLLKENNKLILIIDTPKDEICKIEIDYNWRDKLIKHYEEIFK